MTAAIKIKKVYRTKKYGTKFAPSGWPLTFLLCLLLKILFLDIFSKIYIQVALSYLMTRLKRRKMGEDVDIRCSNNFDKCSARFCKNGCDGDRIR